jgi:drug/metabolite transporter (DMT)-like permease
MLKPEISSPKLKTNAGVKPVGVYSGLLAAFLLGWAPILGKIAFHAQVTPNNLAASRSIVAALFLWLFYLVFWRERIVIRVQDAGICLLVGAINGVGSLFYYNGLGRLDASRASLLGATIPIWVIFFLSASGQKFRFITLLQLVCSFFGAVLVTSPWRTEVHTDFLGIMLMIASAAVNGWYFTMGQWVLSEVPAKSATLYIITGMAVTVTIARFISNPNLPTLQLQMTAIIIIFILGLTTAISRLAMFQSVEILGGAQTAIINLTELAVSLTLAFIILGDRLYWYQWIGAVFLLGGGVLARIAAEHQIT